MSEIIIATNIAGRGTSFKTSVDLEAKGGLHVFVTFLPVNQRVEDQAFGRTARQGKSGTAQLIIKQSDVSQLEMEITENLTFDIIKQRRDEIEAERLKRIEDVELAGIDFMDKIFSKFSTLYRSFKHVNDKFLVKDLKEAWALWLHKKNFTGENVKSLMVVKEFESFKQDVKGIIDGKVCCNPYYSVGQAEKLLDNHNVVDAKVALYNALTIANDNSDVLSSAHLKLFEVAIEEGYQLTERFKKALKKVFCIDLFTNIEKDERYKTEGLVALGKAKQALDFEIDYLRSYLIVEDHPEGSNEPLKNQDYLRVYVATHEHEKNLLRDNLISRYSALQAFSQHIESLTQQINESGNTIGIAINSRIPEFLENPETVNEKKMRESIKDLDLSDLSSIGMSTIYALREVHDVADQIIRGSQAQIAAGLALLATGFFFPFVSPFTTAAAGTLISEGISDIVIELISKGDSSFDATAYIKGKAISYAMSIASMGLSAIASSLKVLNTAIKACKGLANLLRKLGCPSIFLTNPGFGVFWLKKSGFWS
jgi:hypothetical protein